MPAGSEAKDEVGEACCSPSILLLAARRDRSMLHNSFCSPNSSAVLLLLDPSCPVVAARASTASAQKHTASAVLAAWDGAIDDDFTTLPGSGPPDTSSEGLCSATPPPAILT
eukprot:CAMPEP_0181312198 /NCGR_PEP_ID=MMETSP1101-20121128/13563_1 /TAXON_ID=46948 /ORGANISM="Rhodomonas abbreviata, Strain Caron Lab Isolate" /LENGTH=111 /DNA_ID=CAMNT_0023419021 /DNA_START=547 /DNA_END=878 /DNA_ORIENTATION=-